MKAANFKLLAIGLLVIAVFFPFNQTIAPDWVVRTLESDGTLAGHNCARGLAAVQQRTDLPRGGSTV